jgi:hypothetical protein
MFPPMKVTPKRPRVSAPAAGIAVLALALVAGLGARAWAKNPLDLLGGSPPHTTPPVTYGPEHVLEGWSTFLDLWRMVDMLVVFVLAAALGAVIAYHPRTRQKASTVEELEQPKTFIMYALVGAVISIIVQTMPAMSFVIFGIGGLLRFRTDIGPAKDTGRVIMTAVVGVCCGLKLMAVAVVATAFGWVLLWYLERETFGKLLVKGLAREVVPQAAEAYRRVLSQAGCRILGERKKFIKGMVTFVFTVPYTLDRERFEQQFLVAVPEPVRGVVDWDIS